MGLIFPLSGSAFLQEILQIGREQTRYCYCSNCYTAAQFGFSEELSDTENPRKKLSCKPHLINTLIKEGQAGIFITDKRALLYETAEHLSLCH